MASREEANATGPLARLIRLLPRRSDAHVARVLIARADALRDVRAWTAAAALYEQALAFAPWRHRVHIQCGHVWKEAGDYARADRHYAAAMAAMPDDADLALQVGYFNKTAGRTDAAAAAFRRALALEPGWDEPERELARLARQSASGTEQPAAPVSELLPRGVDHLPAVRRDGVFVWRLGGELTLDGPVTRVLRGVEAIHGECVSVTPVREVRLLLDGELVATEPLAPSPLINTLHPGQARYIFNLWHDFSRVVPGEHAIELRFGNARTFRAQVTVASPDGASWRTASDAHIPPLPAADVPLVQRIAALPSVTRQARRTLLPTSPAAILVQRVDQLGDLACSEPALRRLRALFPAAQLVGLVTPANADLARALGCFDALELVSFGLEDSRPTLDASAQAELRHRLTAYHFDLAIDLGEADGSRPLLRLSGAPFLYGFRPRDFPWLSAGLEVTTRDPLNRNETAAHSRKLLALIEGLAALQADQTRTMPRAHPDPALLARYGVAAGQPYAVLHAGARLAFSRWPGFARLAELLLQTGLAVLVMCDTEEDGRIFPPGARLVTGRLPFDDFDALIGGAAVFVGNDSGPKHLAALRGVPVVSLHSARINWNEWGQEQAGVIISRRVPCAGCGIAARPEECGRDFTCIRDIRPDEVLAAVLAQLRPI